MSRYLTEAISNWAPSKRARHCSACLHALVNGDPENPVARCRQGFGRAQPLGRLLRQKNPISFGVARTCPDYAEGDPWEEEE